MALIIGTPDDDILVANAGVNDTLDGGAGIDTAWFASASGVIVDLSSGFAFDSVNGDIDTLISIENVTGSAFNDLLIGDAGANVLQGVAGNDALIGQGGGDVFSYSFGFTAGGGETFSFTQFFADLGGSVVNGEVADGTKQGQFSSLYTQWLKMLVRDHGLGTDVLDLGQNSGVDGTPVIESMTGEFGERESFIWTSGSGKKAVVHERWYSDTWSTGGGGDDSATSADGLDTILDFTWGEDKLNFSGITQQQFTDLFDVGFSQDVTGDLVADTVISINDFEGGSVTLAGVSGHDLLAFANDSSFS